MRAGIFASARHAAGGGSSVSFVEITSGSAGSSTSGSIPISASAATGDLLVVVASRNATAAATLTVGGVGMTELSTIRLGINATRVGVYSMTGLSGSISVAYTTGAASVNRFTVYLVRGLSTATISTSLQSDWTSATTAANTDEGPASNAYASTQAAIFLGVASSGTVTFPSNPTPSSGWTVDRAVSNADGEHRAAHHAATASGTVQANIQSTQNLAQLGAWMLILG